MLKYILLLLTGLLPAMAMAEAFPVLGRAPGVSCESLWVERNQILNVAGQCFETPLGQAVFDNSDCIPGPPALPEAALNRVARLSRAEAGRGCAVDSGQSRVIVHGRYGPLRFGDGEITLGRWPGALTQLDVFPRPARQRSCTVSGLGPEGFLALRSGPDTRYPQIGALHDGERVVSNSACMGRWCFAGRVQDSTRESPRFGWFHVRWCQP